MRGLADWARLHSNINTPEKSAFIYWILHMVHMCGIFKWWNTVKGSHYLKHCFIYRLFSSLQVKNVHDQVSQRWCVLSLQLQYCNTWCMTHVSMLTPMNPPLWIPVVNLPLNTPSEGCLCVLLFWPQTRCMAHTAHSCTPEGCQAWSRGQNGRNDLTCGNKETKHRDTTFFLCFVLCFNNWNVYFLWHRW